MTLTDEQAQAVVEAVLSTLWERRPFKWDLGKMKYEDATEEDKENGRGGPLWEEMLEGMRESARSALKDLP